MMQGKITETDTPTIWKGATPSGLISNPPPPSSSTHSYARCSSCRNPSTLSWLGTGIKYAGFHTQWRGSPSGMVNTMKMHVREVICGQDQNFCTSWRQMQSKTTHLFSISCNKWRRHCCLTASIQGRIEVERMIFSLAGVSVVSSLQCSGSWQQKGIQLVNISTPVVTKEPFVQHSHTFATWRFGLNRTLYRTSFLFCTVFIFCSLKTPVLQLQSTATNANLT